ncbi:FecR family protein [Chitinophaga niastensis]|uniref:FecR family protein n=1 Tax=Chitinophaga niastensis TaxID=536980 RepID=A0A2P8HGS6_CHINA|nr:FecR domain-containing protein [Chitinophaga niastensis]PSL45416.1 FecR family protein [Chitinophaga niastensis]
MQEKEIIEILRKYKSGKATEEEKAFLESWYLQYREQDELKCDARDLLQDAAEIWGNLQKQTPKPKQFILWPRIAAAMLILIFLGGYLFRRDTPLPPLHKTVQQPILPGGNKAMLTLADGTKVSLNDAKKGEIANQAGVKLEKTEDGQIVYTVTNSEESSELPAFNTIETPRGGQFQVDLPDGSKVWLNATSSLKYPVYFKGAKERQVVLKGEAYFEIAKDETKPFIVKTDDQEVRVLGTHFNINAYADEASVRTTLLEGSVQVSSDHVTKQISPGQQTILTNKHINIIETDGQMAIAWKNGQFEFDNADITSVMRQLSRWYDIQVIYEGEIPKLHYSGSVSRNDDISVILSMLKKTGKINFKIDKRNIIVNK